jgi:hypothetical protein
MISIIGLIMTGILVAVSLEAVGVVIDTQDIIIPR